MSTEPPTDPNGPATVESSQRIDANPMDPQQVRADLLKIEYEKAADRYDNIYQSIWTIFSYMSAVTVAFLAFGGERITPLAIASTAPVPLIFWFWSTYLPLDRYGNRTLSALKAIEDRAKSVYDAPLKHYSAFARERHGLWPDFWDKWTVFKKEKKTWPFWRALGDMVKRARFTIWVAFLVVHLFCVSSLSRWSDAGFTFFKQEATTPLYQVKIDSTVPIDIVRMPASPTTPSTPATQTPSEGPKK